MTLPSPIPFDLTAAQARTLQALADTGCRKLVARQLGISLYTVNDHLGVVREKMGARFTLLAVLAWDRVTRPAPKAGKGRPA